MEQTYFFPPHDGVKLSELAQILGAELADPKHADIVIRSVSPVNRAKAGDLCYVISKKSKDELVTCEASAVLVSSALQSIVPAHVPVLVSKNAHAAFAMAGGLLYPSALTPQRLRSVSADISDRASVDPTARLEANVEIEPFAVIGAHAEIGEGTRIGAGAIIGPGVKIGRDCTIASGASILCSLVGNRVIIHNGARIGQDGFGYAPGPRGMIKIVQIGRVILQDDVEVGANTTIDRGTMDDTVIGEGTKIDNLVQIGHNVRIGRHCAVVSQVGIAGSAIIGDGVQIGGHSGIRGHITINDGAQIAAMSGVVSDIPAGERYGGIPARPAHDFLREVAAVMMRTTGPKKTGEKNG
ncbi:UDP-3-O-(3-hydroxymyristoyl)glucosamine N-acyltransferase [Rhizobium sp. 16-449-1b]|uniref:UDP-3-O-(3-hydroxymyristoyl)glucosamine N-acyltransferase n=1 Tax=Rhizobium sp. 16-449-1b TaxID=2819989 RepID=UPI001ADB63A7|nr:UDP-3-O-(3-hydroxymyristoyl)glucosamine N-acyltransferase [Rhizobium sp. 16-449-1b]MBO9194060.1 UDP-3-O-(3-hydroxymyristoyl)glucosamine N-acyltransferase [Rhizobium sp. 16-449-1b]